MHIYRMHESLPNRFARHLWAIVVIHVYLTRQWIKKIEGAMCSLLLRAIGERFARRTTVCTCILKLRQSRTDHARWVNESLFKRARKRNGKNEFSRDNALEMEANCSIVPSTISAAHSGGNGSYISIYLCVDIHLCICETR